MGGSPPSPLAIEAKVPAKFYKKYIYLVFDLDIQHIFSEDPNENKPYYRNDLLSEKYYIYQY